MHSQQYARAAGFAAPKNGEGQRAHVQAPQPAAGEAEARVYLEHVVAGRSRPGELLLLLSELEGHQRRGAACVIERALGVRHG